MNDLSHHAEAHVYREQGFGTPLPPHGRLALLIVDFVVGFADPATFGGGNIAPAIARTTQALAIARQRGWPVAHSRIVYADDGSDDNVFSLKVPGMATLTEHHPNSAIVPELTPARGELVVRKNVPSAFFGTSLAAWLAHRGVRTLLVERATDILDYPRAVGADDEALRSCSSARSSRPGSRSARCRRCSSPVR